MYSTLKISIEEKFLIKILFSEKKLKKEEFDKLNYGELIKLSSSHLMIPALYVNLKRRNYLNYIPKELKKYLKKIYNLNKENNIQLVKEAKELSAILKKNKINHIFLKGTSHILNNLYLDMGERMIGDIDFLYEENELDNLILYLNRSGYKNRFNYKLWRTKHTPRFINPRKQFAIEPHSEILIYRKRKLLKGKKVLNEIGEETIQNLIKICILNYQINDYGNLNASYSYRSIYDFVKLNKIENINLNVLNNKYYRRFLLVVNELGILEYKVRLNFRDKLFLIRLKNKKKYKYFYLIDDFICKKIKALPIIFMQLIEFTINNSYRKNAIKKILKSEKENHI